MNTENSGSVKKRNGKDLFQRKSCWLPLAVKIYKFRRIKTNDQRPISKRKNNIK